MSFNSLLFILFFLPLCIGIYHLLPNKAENIALLMINLLFYALCDELLVVLIVISAMINFVFGQLIYQKKRKTVLIAGIIINLLFLGFFKYYNFFITSFHDIFGNRLSGAQIPGLIPGLVLPLGISFFTFRAISYHIDIYRQKTTPADDLVPFMAYFTLFPLITAGPIVRYTDLHEQLTDRVVSLPFFLTGLERFILGLIKKVLVAGTFAAISDRIFTVPFAELSMGLAWAGILSYTFQIFFDFAGYTDMAIGIGNMLGFRFAENFNYPYIARNIQDFWQRWHMTLSSWLRDYIFLPLAYVVSNRLKKERYFAIRTDRIIYFISILITFFICGFWHGAGWNFIAWGLWFATFLIFEQFGMKRWLKRSWIPVQHLYTLLVVVIGWVIFRSENLDGAISYIGRMFSFSLGDRSRTSELLFYMVNSETLFMTLLAIILSIPALPWLEAIILKKYSENRVCSRLLSTVKIVVLTLFFIVSLSYISSSSYQPFLYKQF